MDIYTMGDYKDFNEFIVLYKYSINDTNNTKLPSVLGKEVHKFEYTFT